MSLNKPTRRWHMDCDAVCGEYHTPNCSETVWGDSKRALLVRAEAEGWSYTPDGDTLCKQCNWQNLPVHGAGHA